VESKAEYNRQYYQNNREKILAWQRAYGAAPENRDRKREWYLRNREQILEKRRAYYAQNRAEEAARTRAYQIRHKDRIRAYGATYRHGMRPDDWAAMWQAQDGRCYLCGEALVAADASTHVDHDHACCGKERSCPACRRGLVHSTCNTAIGNAGDDPARLRRMADALEAAKAQVALRMAAAGDQPALFP
jgi:hypothetical protein